MSQFTDAWSALYAVQTSATGTAHTATIGATAGVPIIAQAVPLDENFAEGSMAYGGTFQIQCLATALSSTEPTRNTAVAFTPIGSVRAVSLSVISVESNNGVFYIVAGDPNAQ